jgi:hypothetical protein
VRGWVGFGGCCSCFVEERCDGLGGRRERGNVSSPRRGDRRQGIATSRYLIKRLPFLGTLFHPPRPCASRSVAKRTLQAGFEALSYVVLAVSAGMRSRQVGSPEGVVKEGGKAHQSDGVCHLCDGIAIFSVHEAVRRSERLVFAGGFSSQRPPETANAPRANVHSRTLIPDRSGMYPPSQPLPGFEHERLVTGPRELGCGC